MKRCKRKEKSTGGRFQDYETQHFSKICCNSYSSLDRRPISSLRNKAFHYLVSQCMWRMAKRGRQKSKTRAAPGKHALVLAYKTSGSARMRNQFLHGRREV